MATFYTFGQTNSVSEDNVLNEIDTYLQLSKDYKTSKIDSSLFFVNKAIVLAENNNDINLDAKLRAHKAGILIAMRAYEEAEKLLNQNIKATGIDSHILGITYNNMGNLFHYKQDFENAIKYYVKASNELTQPENLALLSRALANIGSIHARLGNSQKAIQYMDKALENIGTDDRLKMQILSNQSGVYYDEKNIDKAIALSHEAEALANKYESVSILGLIYSNLCKYYLDKEKYNTAIDYGKKALAIKKNQNQNTSIVSNNLGYAFLQSGNNTEAIYYLNLSLPSAKGELRSLVYNNLSQAYQNTGDYKKAYEYLGQNIKVKDSVDIQAQRAKVNELTEKYESEKQKQSINLLHAKDDLNQSKLKEQRNLIWALTIFVLSMIGLGILIYRNQKIKLLLNTSKIQNKLLQTQLNPHFLFNALNSMQGFNYSDEKKKLSDYINSFSKLMRSILESSDQDFITIEEDANALNEYIQLQLISSNNNFTATVSIGDDLNPETLMPPMFTQPFVENAIIHGMKDLKNGGIDIKYTEKENKLICIIQDNGKGFSVTTADNSEKLHRSMSVAILKERITNLRKTAGYNCEMQTMSSDTGTTVMLKFPLRQKKLKVSLKNE